MTLAFALEILGLWISGVTGMLRRQSRAYLQLLWRTRMLMWAERVPIIEILMLRRLLDMEQLLLLNPLLVRSMASMILMVGPPLMGRLLIGTL